MRTGELNSKFAPVAKSAQLVFEQMNIQAQRFCRANGNVWLVVRIESRGVDRDIVGARRQGGQRVTTLLGGGGFVNRFCVSVRGLNLRIRDWRTVGVDHGAGDRPSALRICSSCAQEHYKAHVTQDPGSRRGLVHDVRIIIHRTPSNGVVQTIVRVASNFDFRR